MGAPGSGLQRARLEELQQTVCIDLLVIDSTDLPALTQSWTGSPLWAVVPGWADDKLWVRHSADSTPDPILCPRIGL